MIILLFVEFAMEIIHVFLNVCLFLHRLFEEPSVPFVSAFGKLSSIDNVLKVLNLINDRLLLLVFPLVNSLDLFELPFEP